MSRWRFLRPRGIFTRIIRRLDLALDFGVSERDGSIIALGNQVSCLHGRLIFLSAELSYFPFFLHCDNLSSFILRAGR